MYVLTSEITIDKDLSLNYDKLFITGGSFNGNKVIGRINDTMLQVDCDSITGYSSINVYLDIFRRSFSTKTLDINDDISIDNLVHIGGILVDCTDNRKEMISFIDKEDKCLLYKRGFDESFSIDFYDTQEVINICEDFKKEFTDSFNTDYNINEQGTGIILDCRVYGNDDLIDGNIDSINGNEPTPDCN